MSVTGVHDLANEQFCYLTTTGRVTGKPHEIEIWFSIEGETLYMLSGGGDRSDWVKNLRQNPEVKIRIADTFFEGHARVIEDAAEDELARRLLVEKYESSPGSLSNWRRRALPVAVDLRRRRLALAHTLDACAIARPGSAGEDVSVGA